ncbi:hypothetical protein DID96_31030 [Burkholderia sp. Bp8963]|uniref:hypothetical protein n=1 Tax=Burkholderia sp. Bp8963 TaxID=2184547 RepID=UPI000F5B6B7E|nr:hypothetical protein [Burkholderia sp. Bp8963]RQS62627.1 hypothetical protein DID96_31030 [Burkholderia sp. Bp8963]
MADVVDEAQAGAFSPFSAPAQVSTSDESDYAYRDSPDFDSVALQSCITLCFQSGYLVGTAWILPMEGPWK